MSLIVQKYGGTSVGTTERIKNVARRIAHFHRQGHQLVVVVSAMSGETNRLLALARELSADPDPRELDVVAATGEQVTIGLLAIVLKEMGLDLPPEIEIRVWDTTADTRYMVLPMQPPETIGWPEDKLVSVVTRDSMIGVARL